MGGVYKINLQIRDVKIDYYSVNNHHLWATFSASTTIICQFCRGSTRRTYKMEMCLLNLIQSLFRYSPSVQRKLKIYYSIAWQNCLGKLSRVLGDLQLWYMICNCLYWQGETNCVSLKSVFVISWFCWFDYHQQYRDCHTWVELYFGFRQLLGWKQKKRERENERGRERKGRRKRGKRWEGKRVGGQKMINYIIPIEREKIEVRHLALIQMT